MNQQSPWFQEFSAREFKNRMCQEETCPRLGHRASTRASEAVLDAEAFAAKTSKKKYNACSSFVVSGDYNPVQSMLAVSPQDSFGVILPQRAPKMVAQF